MPAQQAANPLAQLPIIPYLLIFVIFYFLVFKPQKDKQKKQKNMVESMKKNDQIITAGGMHGTIVSLKEKTITIRVDEGVKIEFDRESISKVVTSESKKEKKS
ncbi:hypothetical protein MNBD_BACTEROID05-1298 [hydrothermal vent metagenome]|uniref:Protein translocase subunit YajC n=1 Tax=hydrothermal vent metagenome TaxID=652676 RepID=A0A3B0TGM0_9ZZZZ